MLVFTVYQPLLVSAPVLSPAKKFADKLHGKKRGCIEACLGALRKLFFCDHPSLHFQLGDSESVLLVFASKTSVQTFAELATQPFGY